MYEDAATHWTRKTVAAHSAEGSQNCRSSSYHEKSDASNAFQAGMNALLPLPGCDSKDFITKA